MKYGFYYCDAGAIAIKCGMSIIRYSNNYGDCESKAYYMTEKEFEKYKKDHEEYGIKDSDYLWLQWCYFKNAAVLRYDCWHDATNIEKADILFKLNGTIDIYLQDRKFYFIKRG